MYTFNRVNFYNSFETSIVLEQSSNKNHVYMNDFSANFSDVFFRSCQPINQQDGGALSLTCSEVFINNCVFINCSAFCAGGAISSQRCYNFTCLGSQFQENTAYQSSGAISFYLVLLTNLQNCNFTQNKCRKSVCCISFLSGTDAFFSFNIFHKNSGKIGGVILADSGNSNIKKAFFLDNQSPVIIEGKDYFSAAVYFSHFYYSYGELAEFKHGFIDFINCTFSTSEIKVFHASFENPAFIYQTITPQISHYLLNENTPSATKSRKRDIEIDLPHPTPTEDVLIIRMSTPTPSPSKIRIVKNMDPRPMAIQAYKPDHSKFLWVVIFFAVVIILAVYFSLKKKRMIVNERELFDRLQEGPAKSERIGLNSSTNDGILSTESFGKGFLGAEFV